MKTKGTFLTNCSLLFAFLVLFGATVYGGGYTVVTSTGIPFKWNPALAVPFNPDLGPLGTLTNADAVTFVTDKFDVWATGNIPTSSLSFTNAGALAMDVNSDSTFNLVSSKNDGKSPIIFDTDGSIIDAMGLPPGVIGFATPEFIRTVAPFYITEGLAVLNGAFIDGDNSDGREISLEDFGGVFAHEFGHFLNLDHTQINGQFFLGDSDDPGFVTYGTPPISSVNLMFPILVPGQPNTPQFDDIIWISNLYPKGGFPGNFGTIRGSILQSDGTTLLQGANVIVRNPANPFMEAASNVSGALDNSSTNIPAGGSPPAGEEGAYEIPGLSPGGQYTVEIVNVNQQFTEGSSVGPIDPPLILPAPEEFYNGANESSDNNVDDPLNSTNVTAATGAGTSGIDIILNEQTEFLNPPLNLAATVSQNDVTLNWNDPSSAQEFELAFDSGSFQIKLVQTSPIEFANGPFIPPAFPATIRSAKFITSGDRTGDPVDIRIYVDDTGTANIPSSSLLVATIDSVIIGTGGAFQEVDLNSLGLSLSSGGRFFIGVFQPGSQGNGILVDTTAASGKSFFDSNLDGVFSSLAAGGVEGALGIRAVVTVNSSATAAPESRRVTLTPQPTGKLQRSGADVLDGRAAQALSQPVEAGQVAMASDTDAEHQPGIVPLFLSSPASPTAILQGFNVFRATSANARSNGTLITSLNATTISFLDENLNKGTFFYQVTAVYDLGESGPSNEVQVEITTTAVADETPGLPTQYALQQNHPNPFNPTTLIKYSIPVSHSNQTVRLQIYNILGQKIRTLIAQKQTAGEYTIAWDGSSDLGVQVSSGVYVYQLRAGNFVQSKKMVLLR
ncbi:MAG: FlgD immunoglobulin-like domain containing protein [bacterium]